MKSSDRQECRLRLRKRIISASVAAGILLVLFLFGWFEIGRPPMRLMLKHGLPGGDCTGRTRTVQSMTFVELSAGYFRMGSQHNPSRRSLFRELARIIGIGSGQAATQVGEEYPLHWVEIAGSFWIATTEVTNEQLTEFRHSVEDGHDRPVDIGSRYAASDVDWTEASAFCSWASGRLQGEVMRLPTEAEWEYACRAGSRADFCFGDDVSRLEEFACYGRGKGGGPLEVGSLRPNSWGAYDMHGGVWEWCLEAAAGEVGGRFSGRPPFTYSYTGRVLRGGSLSSDALDCRSTGRRVVPESDLTSFREKLLPRETGFRPVIVR